jgi:hypothetical protein
MFERERGNKTRPRHQAVGEVVDFITGYGLGPRSCSYRDQRLVHCCF